MNNGQPLLGKRVLITRSSDQAQEFINLITELGGEAVPCPVIKTVLPEDTLAIDTALRNLSSYDWIIFTSVNGLRFFLQRGRELGIPIQEKIQGRVAAVGTQTAAALHNERIRVDHIPPKFTAEHLLESLKGETQPGQKVLIPHANLAKKDLARELEKLGLVVDDIVFYETIPDESCKEKVCHLLTTGQIDIVTFTSPSTVRNFLALLEGLNWKELLNSVTVAVIGPVTAKAALQLGLKVDITAKEYSIPGLMKEMVKASRED